MRGFLNGKGPVAENISSAQLVDKTGAVTTNENAVNRQGKAVNIFDDPDIKKKGRKI